MIADPKIHPPALVKLGYIAERAGVTSATVRRWLAGGQITGLVAVVTPKGRVSRVTKASADAWLSRINPQPTDSTK